MNLHLSRIQTDLDFNKTGRQIGDFRLRPSDNSRALGYHPIPAACLKNGDGPTMLITGGTHGDEFEGPAAILRLIHSLDVDRLNGRLILLPALNAPAVRASSRCSVLDGGNLNRSFPGNANGTATEQIAHLVESVILPVCDAAIDIHSGGHASEFVPLTMFVPDSGQGESKNQPLADAFAAPWSWQMGSGNDDRSVNGAAHRADVAMFATELGGGGNVNGQYVQLAVDGILRCLQHLGMWDNAPPPPQQMIQRFDVPSTDYTVYANRDGLFLPAVELGQRIKRNDRVGYCYSIFETERTPVDILANNDGVVVSLTRKAQLERGDFIAQLGRIQDQEQLRAIELASKVTAQPVEAHV